MKGGPQARSQWTGQPGRGCAGRSFGQGAGRDDAVDGVGDENLARLPQDPRANRRLEGGDPELSRQPQDSLPGDSGEDPAVCRRGPQDALGHREDAGPVGLQNVPVRVLDHEMLVRARAGPSADLIEDPAVQPLMRAEPSGDRERAQSYCLGGRSSWDYLDSDLDRAADRPGRYPQAARGAGGQALRQFGGQAWRERSSENLPDAGVQPREVGVEIAAPAVGDTQRGEYPQRGPRPRSLLWSRRLAEPRAERADQRDGFEEALTVFGI